MSIFEKFFKKRKHDNNNIELIRQTRTGEDGLACLAMIFAAHKAPVTIELLQKTYPQHLTGICLKSIIDIFTEYNFSTTPLHCPIYEIKNLKLPCILHWEMKQFVVLSYIKDGVFTVLNPANKKMVQLTQDEFEQHYCEIALEIHPANHKN